MLNANSNPISRLLHSSKALVVLALCLASFVALFLGKVSWAELTDFLKLIVGPWLVAVGVEDAAKHLSSAWKASSDSKAAQGPQTVQNVSIDTADKS